MLTDRDRLLVGSYSAIGTLSEKKAYPRQTVRLEELAQEKQGVAAKLNPLVPEDHSTYQATVVTTDGPLKLCGIPSNFVDGLRA